MGLVSALSKKNITPTLVANTINSALEIKSNKFRRKIYNIDAGENRKENDNIQMQAKRDSKQYDFFIVYNKKNMYIINNIEYMSIKIWLDFLIKFGYIGFNGNKLVIGHIRTIVTCNDITCM